MKLVLVALFTAFYLLMAIRFFKVWWVFFKRDTDLSLNWTYISIAVLTLASASWPVVVPFAYLELLAKVQRNAAEFQVEASETETSELEEEKAEPKNFVSPVEL
ncbi:hypothetical protein H6F88_05785 [Oculatella sp. FACHB-28]|uniref:hypothetical protein n=1 Tax=Oculatella sp. FACHB-28 TaxID=2692845 RepID=UPI00168890D7|nr:hypothetical protein [Oculatella sp. FACHB-28]MBD2055535.1 hypothetical protein [Oculatella sp. FACHB-28]